MISWKLTVEKILSFSWDLYMSSARSSWFTGDKQGTLTLFFCVVIPLYDQFFDWNCCVDIASEGKVWKSVQKSLLTAFFTGTITWGIEIYHFSAKLWTFLGYFQVPGKNVLIKNKVHTCIFKKITKIYYIFGKNARNKCFRIKYRQFSANFGQICAFLTPRH